MTTRHVRKVEFAPKKFLEAVKVFVQLVKRDRPHVILAPPRAFPDDEMSLIIPPGILYRRFWRQSPDADYVCELRIDYEAES